MEPAGHHTGCSVLGGPQHDAQARHMTKASAVAVLCCCGVLGLLCAPFVLALPAVFVLYISAEVVFAVLYWYRYLLLSYQPIKHRPLSHDPIVALQRTLQHLQRGGADIRDFLSIWFHGAPVDSIKRGNVKDLIAYAFWYKTPSEVAAEGRDDELDQQVSTLESIWNLRLQPGYDPQLTCMAHLWEPMKHWYKPLAFYLAMEAAALLCSVALQAAGFQRHVWMGLPYYTRNMPVQPVRHSIDIPPEAYVRGRRRSFQAPATSAQPFSMLPQRHSTPVQRRVSLQQTPLVLLHGIGMGLIPYISMLFNMAATGRPVLALELPHVSQRWVLWVPTVDEVAEVVVSILNRNDVSSCCLIGHSYGTAVGSRLLQQVPERIQQLCLIDPICFTMFMPNLLRNFLYESPRSGSWLGDFMMVSAARDLHVSATLSRRFFWSDVNLWEEQVPDDTLVVLSGRDALMAAPQVRTWLEEHTQAVIMYHPHMVHAGFLMDIPWQQQILQQLLMLLDSKVTTGGYKPGQGPPSHDGPGRRRAPQATAQQGGNSTSSSTRTCGHLQMQHAGNGTAGSGFVGACAGPGYSTAGLAAVQDQPVSSSGSSCAGSEHSYVSCVDGTSSDSSSTSSTARSPKPAAAAGLIVVDQQGLVAATVASQMRLPASPFSPVHHSECHTEGLSEVRGVECIDRISVGGLLSSCTSVKLGSSFNTFNSTSLHQSQYPVRSRDGSLELAPSMCMRSWSGVLPCTSVTDASTASESGQPESPRSWNTFVSASSVQSRRSLAAAAAAQEARQAAQMLLQPLMAPVQQQQGQKGDSKQLQDAGEQSLRRVTWGSSGSGELLSAQNGSGTAAAGAECLISYRSIASESKDSKHCEADTAATAAAPAAADQHCGRLEQSSAKAAAAAAGAAAPAPLQPVYAAAGGAVGGAGMGLRRLTMRPGAGKGSGGPKGMLKRVEGMWQGRARTSGKGSHTH